MRNKIKEKNFNILITGVGGQGIITLTKILAESALREGFDVKTSELHGLSQRGGSVITHIRFGKKIYSPLISKGEADLIVSLEIQEAVRVWEYAHFQKTVFLINDFFKPISSSSNLSKKACVKELEKISKRIILVDAMEISQKEFKNPVFSGILLLSKGIKEGLFPLTQKVVLEGIKKVVKKEYFLLNKKAFLFFLKN